MLKISFSIRSFISYLNPRHQKSFVTYDNFIVIGLNEWFDSHQLVYIQEKDLQPLSSSSFQKKPKQNEYLEEEQQIYTVSGKLQKGDNNRENHLAIPELLCQYVILQENRFEIPCCQRSSNCVLLDWTFIKNPGKLPKILPMTKMLNKLKELVCQFQITIHNIEMDPLILTIICNGNQERKCNTTEEAGKILAKIHQTHMSTMSRDFHTFFRCCHPDTDDIYVFQDINFWGGRPLLCYLDTKVQPSNEAYWVHLFGVVMRLYIFDAQMESLPDEKTLWQHMSVDEQLSILVDMCIIGANNSIYLGDYVESPVNGFRKGSMACSDDFSSLRYNTGDCEDCSNWVHYCFRTFRRSGPYNHYALSKLHKLAYRYECILVLSGVNKPSMSDTFGIGGECESYMAHMTTLFIHKDLLLENILKGTMSLGEMKKTNPNENIVESLNELIARERKDGHLKRDTSDEFVVNNTDGTQSRSKLPMVFVGEGTGYLNPNGVDRVKFPKITKSGKIRLYQSRTNNTTFMRLHFVGITNYFVQNGINISTFVMTYDPAKWKESSSFEKGFIYGVQYSDVMAPNPDMIFVPMSGFASVTKENNTLKDIMNLCKIEARRKLPYPPLWRNNENTQQQQQRQQITIERNKKTDSEITTSSGSSNSSSNSSNSSSSTLYRNACCRKITLPKNMLIPACINQRCLDELYQSRMKMTPPNTAKKIGYNMILPWVFYKTRYMYYEDILWWEYEQLHDDLSIFIVYFSIVEEENSDCLL